MADDLEEDDPVEVLIGTRLIEGVVDEVDLSPSFNSSQRIHVDVGDSIITVSSDQVQSRSA